MFQSDSEVSARLGNPKNLTKRVQDKPRRQLEDRSERKQIREEILEIDDDGVVREVSIAPLHNGGRRQGDRNLLPEMRGLIGAVANQDTIANTAEAFGVSPHHVHELKHGKHSNAQGENEELINEVNKNLKAPHDIAVEKLTEALLEITPQRIKLISKTKDLVDVASKLSRVVANTAPIDKNNMNAAEGTKLVVYAPTFKQENNYNTVSVSNSQNNPG